MAGVSSLGTVQKERKQRLMERAVRPVEHMQNYPSAPRIVPDVDFFALCCAPTKTAAVTAITKWPEENRRVYPNTSGTHTRIKR